MSFFSFHSVNHNITVRKYQRRSTFHLIDDSVDRFKDCTFLQEIYETTIKREQSKILDETRVENEQERRVYMRWVGTDEVVNDRVHEVGREGRGEAGQQAEEGDEPEFRRRITARAPCNQGSSG
jgi:hypothetical protein